MKEYVIWGVAPGTKDEQPLFTCDKDGKEITDKKFADYLAAEAKRRGATGVRIQTLDMETPPDFAGTLRSFSKAVPKKKKGAK